MRLKNLLLITCLLSFTNLSFGATLLDTLPPQPMPDDNSEKKIYQIADEVPLFSVGCEEEDYAAKKICADNKMLEFIYMNVTYPYEARINEIEGTVVVTFVIEKDGQLTNIKILKNPGGGLGEDVERVIKAMPANWQPATINGKTVRFKYALPVKYRLETNEETKKFLEEQRQQQEQTKKKSKRKKN